MGKYVSPESVKQFLESKVSFGPLEDQISDMELIFLIQQAESKVEMELSNQYVIPFVGYINGNIVPYNEIPYETTTMVVNNLCLYRSCYNVIKLFFGKTGENRGKSYLDFIADMYQDLYQPLQRKRNTGVFDIPPLQGLFLNANSQRTSPVLPSPIAARVGHSVNSFEYANRHVNDPTQSIFWGQTGPNGGPGWRQQ
jgi:hypothetical protein